jgi:dolichyl-phosphate beta-glucosyltransferase
VQFVQAQRTGWCSEDQQENFLSADTSSGESQEVGAATAAATAQPYLSIVVPAYNEEKRLGASLKRMLAYFDTRNYDFEILVVNDGSTDETASIVQNISACRPEVRLLEYASNHGKGYAVRYGMLRAVGRFVLFSDADLATPIEEVEKLIAALEVGADVAIGSRDVAGSELVQRESIIRELGGRTFNKLVQLLTVPGIHDTQCGFKLFTAKACKDVFGICKVDDFAFDVEALYVAVKLLGLRVAEVPIKWAHQAGSKISPFRDGPRMVRTLFKIRMTRYGVTPAAVKSNPDLR